MRIVGVVKIIGGAVAALVALVALLFVAARFHDGPLAVIPGGPLVAGELVADPVVDWRFAEDVQEIELQLADEDTSRTVWILVSDGRAFVPCSLSFPPGKRWYRAAEQDGRAVVRVNGKRYPVTLDRISDPALEQRLAEVTRAKYERVPPTDGGVWFFSITSRT